MERVVNLVGWALAVVAVVAVGALFYQLRQERNLAAVQEAQARQEQANMEARLAEMEQELQSLKNAAASQPPAFDPSTMLKSLVKGIDETGKGEPANPLAGLLESLGGEDSPLAAFGQMLATEGEDASAEAGEQMMKGMMKLVGSEMAESVMEPMLDMQLETQYAALFDELGLEPEVEQRVRDIYSRHMREATKKVFEVFSGDSDFASIAESTEQTNELVRAELAEVLTPEQLETVDAYEAELPRRMAREGYDTQLRMFAPGLDPDTRAYVAEVFVEETVPKGQSQLTDPAGVAGHQAAAFDSALARLSTELEPDQYARVERFIQQQQRMMDWSANLFGIEDETAAP